MKRWALAIVVVLALFTGCVPSKPLLPTPRPVTMPPATLPPSPSLSPLPDTSPLPTQSPLAPGPCELIATHETTVYITPGHEPIPGTLERGMRLPVTARTADGWLGFDPGYAHAAAVGLLRLYWVPEDEVELEGDCATLPVVEAPRPDLYCYEMAMYDIPLRAAPDATAMIVGTLHRDTYAILLGFSPNGAWGKVLLDDGTEGWFDLEALNITGACDNLPTLQP